ncbi:LPXTG cell wall anchor domain-containing protein, partial [Listeria rocourtiae]|uniref:MucBP domain-containing protein n=2 Tax=Listeria rocourtiae TaxID=647910 RepID=UPI001628C92B
GITSLEGLQYAKNIDQLLLRGNQITDVSPLNGLPRLRILTLANNPIKDVSVLEDMPALYSLDLSNNGLKTLPKTMTGFPKLEYIHFKENQLTDVSVMAELPNIKYISISKNQITDISALASLVTLRDLIANFNHISDITAFQVRRPAYFGIGRQTVTLPTQKIGRKGTLHMPQPIQQVLGPAGSMVIKDFQPTNGSYETEQQRLSWSGLPGPSGAVTYGWNDFNPAEGVGRYFSGTATIPYRMVDASPVTVVYQDTTGKAIAPSTTLTGDYGEAYDTTPLEIPGYTVDTSPANAKGTYTEATQTVTYVYEKATAAPVTVVYQDTTGKEVAPSERLTGKVDAPYAAEAKAISGYTLTQKPANQTGYLTNEPQMVTFVYEAQIGGAITVQPTDNLENVLAPEEKLTGNYHAPYKTEAMMLPTPPKGEPVQLAVSATSAGPSALTLPAAGDTGVTPFLLGGGLLLSGWWLWRRQR